MLPSERRILAVTSPLALSLALALTPSAALARDQPPSKVAAPSASASGSAATPPGQSAAATAPLPAGHPSVPMGGEGEEDEEEGARPSAPVPGMFQPPPDSAEEDASLPAGTLAIDVKDADNRPLPKLSLVVSILHQSIAKGQSKEYRSVVTDAGGHAVLEHLDVGSEVSYSVKHMTGGATFMSPPAQLNALRGERIVLHVYKVVHDLLSASVAAQGTVFFEVKDDRIQVEEGLTLYNFGRTAWLADDVVMKLPEGFTAVTSQGGMSDEGVDAVEKVGARIHGTFAPGRHDLEFRWQLPYHDEKELEIDVNLPPNVAIMRVLAAAGRETTLKVTGFPEAQKQADRQGGKVLITEKQTTRAAPLQSVHVVIGGLITPGPARLYASGLAALTVFLGLFLGVGRKASTAAGARSERADLLAEMEELERLHRSGEIGPKTYERTRRELVDAIAQTLEPAA